VPAVMTATFPSSLPITISFGVPSAWLAAFTTRDGGTELKDSIVREIRTIESGVSKKPLR
jgi:hypothetical protein